MYAAVCDWSDRYYRDQEAHLREGQELSTEDLTNLTHRKDLTALGSRMRDNEDSKTISQVSQEAGFQHKLEKGQYVVTRLSIKKSEGSTLVFKEYSLLRSDRDTQLVCDLRENVRIGSVVEATTIYIYIYIYIYIWQDWNPQKSWYHRQRTSTLMFISR